jgi:hypothetical protein
MARTLSPFTRLVLLIGELNSNKIEDLGDVKKCDLIYHTSKLHEEIEDNAQKESAVQIARQGESLLSEVNSGNFGKAEEERQTLIAACKKLKDLM